MEGYEEEKEGQPFQPESNDKDFRPDTDLRSQRNLIVEEPTTDIIYNYQTSDNDQVTHHRSENIDQPAVCPASNPK